MSDHRCHNCDALLSDCDCWMNPIVRDERPTPWRELLERHGSQLTECRGDPLLGDGFAPRSHPSGHAADGVDGASRFDPYRKGKAA